jgi:hypothetical protein
MDNSVGKLTFAAFLVHLFDEQVGPRKLGLEGPSANDISEPP